MVFRSPRHASNNRNIHIPDRKKQVLDPLVRSTSTVENDITPHSGVAKVFLLHKKADGNGVQQQDQDEIKILVQDNPSPSGGLSASSSSSSSSSITTSRVITRNASAADSVVDVWTPAALRRLSSKYDTDTESSLKQSRPVSKRGVIPAFADVEEGEESAGTPAGRVAPTVFDTAPYGGGRNVKAGLSPIHSVRGSMIDLSQPISLDALRDPVSTVDSTPRNAGHQRKVSLTRRPSIVPMDSVESFELDEVEHVSESESVSSASSSRPPTPTTQAPWAGAVEDEDDEPEKSDSVSTVAIQGPLMEEPPPALFPSPMDSKGNNGGVSTNDPFCFNGDTGKSVLGSPALSSAPSNAPKFVVGDNPNSIFAADANNSSLWAAAAAAAHRRNASALSLSSELQAMSQVSRTNPETENPSVLRQALRLVGLVKSASRVMPGPGPESSANPRPPSPDASALLPGLFDSGISIKITSPAKTGGSSFMSGEGNKSVTPLKPDQSPFFAGEGGVEKTPMVSPSGSETGSSTSSTSTAASSPRAAAAARVEVEGDVEEGGVNAATADGGRVGVATGTRVAVETATRTSTRVAGPAFAKAMAADIDMVLPNSPSDDEKVKIVKRIRRHGLSVSNRL